MGRITDINDALEKYKGSSNNDFFTLENDKDAARVRFLIGDELKKDEDWFVVHEVEVGSKKRWVLCTEEGDCPLCKVSRPQLKLFLQLSNITAKDAVQTWERGQKMVPQIQGLMNKYGALYNRPYEIIRNGKKGDNNTTYQTFAEDKDGKTLEELPEKQNLLGDLIPESEGGDEWSRKGGFILVLNHEDMKLAANRQYDPSKAKVETPPRRSSSDSAQERF